MDVGGVSNEVNGAHEAVCRGVRRRSNLVLMQLMFYAR